MSKATPEERANRIMRIYAHSWTTEEMRALTAKEFREAEAEAFDLASRIVRNTDVDEAPYRKHAKTWLEEHFGECSADQIDECASLLVGCVADGLEKSARLSRIEAEKAREGTT